MKERNWKALAEELTDLVGNSTTETAVEVNVWNGQALELYPKEGNLGTCFYHMAEVVDFCRCKKLSCYVTTDYYDSAKLICRIY